MIPPPQLTGKTQAALLSEQAGNEECLHTLVEWLTIGEAAARLGVSVPRLRRLLALPDFAPLVETRTRQTRTGTRTAQGVSVPVLVQLEAGLQQTHEEKPVKPPAEPERVQERERAAEPFETVPVDGFAMQPVLIERETEVDYLRARLSEALHLLAREQQAHAETRRLIVAQHIPQELPRPVDESASEPQDVPQGFTGGDSTGETVSEGESEPKRGLWARLFGRQEGR